MKIRTKLSLTISAIVAAAMAAAGMIIVRVQASYLKSDQDAQIQMIENSLRHACLNDLLEKDDLRLVSYVNFLKAQYPALSGARVVWKTRRGAREVKLGSAPRPDRREERLVSVSDPLEPSRKIEVSLEIDAETLERDLAEARGRLVRIIFLIALLISLLGVMASFAISLRVAAPLEALGREARRIGSGKTGQRIAWRSHDEMGAFVEVFNEMSESLSDLDRAKKLFISSVTHELRSPLGAIESMLELVESRLGDLPEASRRQVREYLSRIQGNVSRLGEFVGDMLDAAKVEMGALECRMASTSVEKIAEDAREFFEARARSQGVSLELKVSSGTPPVMADSGRIRQVLVNLLSNALKFTPAGGRVDIEISPSLDGDGNFVDVAVTDTGRGIPAADIPRLFKPFFQGSNVAAAGNGSGTGLGLYLVKSIVETHGGRVAVSSDSGRGTTVSFSLKAAPVP